MNSQARLLQSVIGCTVDRQEAPNGGFCKTGAGVEYLTLHRGLQPSNILSSPNLYGFNLRRLQSFVSVKATDSGLETLRFIRRADRLKKTGGVFMLVTWQSLLYPFYGVLLSGSRKAIRVLMSGVSNLIATPTPRLETESGINGYSLGGFYYA